MQLPFFTFGLNMIIRFVSTAVSHNEPFISTLAKSKSNIIGISKF